mmetsp:Transcript_22050/g.63055  ORF Transcript_22050/g.63055 Transcript_22050/m.63055 type:complete len:211 (+) Transcript_22050:658-1290(+)
MAQPTKHIIAETNERQRKSSLQISRAKTKVKIDDVDESTVFVATEVCSKLRLNTQADAVHKKPTVVAKPAARLRDAMFSDAFKNPGSSKSDEAEALNKVKKAGLSYLAEPADIHCTVRLDPSQSSSVPRSMAKPTIRGPSSSAGMRAEAIAGDAETVVARAPSRPRRRKRLASEMPTQSSPDGTCDLQSAGDGAICPALLGPTAARNLCV